MAPASSLKEQGFSQELLAWHKRSGWLESYGHGAYILAGDKVEWTGALYALQIHLKMPVHAGGKTALELKGYSHFVPVRQKVFLYGERGSSLPAWFRKSMKPGEYEYVRTNLFAPGYANGLSSSAQASLPLPYRRRKGLPWKCFTLCPRTSGLRKRHSSWKILRACGRSSFRNSGACRFVKVKRLFLYLSEKYAHPWFSRLDLSKPDLGKGKRQIVPHGMLDKKYQITVPRQERESTE